MKICQLFLIVLLAAACGGKPAVHQTESREQNSVFKGKRFPEFVILDKNPFGRLGPVTKFPFGGNVPFAQRPDLVNYFNYEVRERQSVIDELPTWKEKYGSREQYPDFEKQVIKEIRDLNRRLESVVMYATGRSDNSVKALQIGEITPQESGHLLLLAQAEKSRLDIVDEAGKNALSELKEEISPQSSNFFVRVEGDSTIVFYVPRPIDTSGELQLWVAFYSFENGGWKYGGVKEIDTSEENENLLAGFCNFPGERIVSVMVKVKAVKSQAVYQGFESDPFAFRDKSNNWGYGFLADLKKGSVKPIPAAPLQ